MNTKNTNRRFMMVSSFFVALTAIIIAITLVLIKPAKITKTALESESWKEAFSAKIKDLTGLELQYDSLSATEELNFVMQNMRLHAPNNSQSPNCFAAKVEGKIKNSWKYADIERLEIQNPVCKFYTDSDGYITGLDHNYQPSISDLGILFGAKLGDIQFNNLTLDVIRVTDGNPDYRTIAKHINANFSAEFNINTSFISGSFANISGENLSIAVQQLSADANNSVAYWQGDMNFYLDSNDKNEFKVSGKLVDQDFLANLDTKNFPIKLNGIFKVKDWQELQIEQLDLDILDAMHLKMQGRGYLEDAMQKFVAKFTDIELKSYPKLREMTGFYGASSPLLQFSGGKANFTLDRSTLLDNVNLDVLFPSFNAEINEKDYIQFGDTHLALNASYDPKGNAYPFKMKFKTKKIAYPSQRIHIDDQYFAGSGNIKDFTLVEFKEFVMGTKNSDSMSHITGYVDFGKENLVVDLDCKIFQRLDPFAFENLDVTGVLKGPFTISTDNNGNLKYHGNLEIDIPKISHENLEILGVKSAGPINLAMRDGIASDVLHNLNPDSILDEYFNAFSHVEFKTSLKVEMIKYRESADQQDWDMELPNLEMTANYLNEYEKDATDLDGKFAFDKIKTVRPDGLAANFFKSKVRGDWKFINTGDGGVQVSANAFYGKADKSDLLLNLTLEKSKESLRAQYDVDGNVGQALEDMTGVELMGSTHSLNVKGEMEFAKFFSIQDETSLSPVALNFPYEGEIVGDSKITFSRLKVQDIDQTSELTFPILELSVAHNGDVFNQVFSGNYTAATVDAKIKSGTQYYINDLRGIISGQMDLPIPSDRLTLNATANIGKIEIHGSRSAFNKVKLHFSGTLEEGTLIDVSRFDLYDDKDNRFNLIELAH